MTTPTLQTEVVTITPELAEKLLSKNSNNRVVREKIVQRYARDMRNGNWGLNGESVKLAPNGTLLDGQHRLLACIDADAPFDTVLIRGVQVAVRESMDTGAKRTFADLLRWRGETAAPALGAAIEAGLCWDLNGSPLNRGVTHSNSERMEWFDANPDIREAVRVWGSFSGGTLKIPQSAGAPFFMRINRIAPVEAETFVKALKTGANLGDENDPIVRLRSWAFRTATSKGRFAREEYTAVLIKAWNAWITGRPVRNLSWRRGGSRPEDYPVLLCPDGRTYDEWLAEQNASAPDPLSAWLTNA